MLDALSLLSLLMLLLLVVLLILLMTLGVRSRARVLVWIDSGEATTLISPENSANGYSPITACMKRDARSSEML